MSRTWGRPETSGWMVMVKTARPRTVKAFYLRRAGDGDSAHARSHDVGPSQICGHHIHSVHFGGGARTNQMMGFSE